MSVNPRTGDTTTLFALGAGQGMTLGQTFRLYSVPRANVNIRMRTINPALAMPLGDGLYAVDYERVFGGP